MVGENILRAIEKYERELLKPTLKNWDKMNSSFQWVAQQRLREELIKIREMEEEE